MGRIRLNQNAVHRGCNYHNYRNRSRLTRTLNEEMQTKKDSPRGFCLLRGDMRVRLGNYQFIALKKRAVENLMMENRR